MLWQNLVDQHPLFEKPLLESVQGSMLLSPILRYMFEVCPYHEIVVTGNGSVH
jgi:hypothetical protein